MPYEENWVDPEVFLTHKGVTVYHSYHNDDLKNGPMGFYFLTDKKGSIDDSFDIRDFDGWKGDIISDSAQKDFLIDCIDKGLITPGPVYDDDPVHVPAQLASQIAITGLPFTLQEASDREGAVSGSIQIAGNSICFLFDGHSDCCSKDNEGVPLLIELWEGELHVRAYSDINREDPVHNISLAGARNERRQPYGQDS